ncbi:MAG: DUF4329 domain-containing protein [Candidatus Kapabacteria bacterium]|nr:DUF4329 domain-containing protein [Candidatus Kapabacteria bacterium]
MIITAQYDYAPFGSLLKSWTNPTVSFTSRTKFLEKEKDAESGDNNLGVRQYGDNIGRFFCPDKMWEKYYSLSPYVYALNNPVRLFDNNGYLPGDAFASIKSAAMDFAKLYNPASINMCREFGATIYKVKGESGDYYTYSIPNLGKTSEVVASDPPDGTKESDVKADIHTHGCYLRPSDNEFSTTDEQKYIDNKIIGFVVTPSGAIWKFDPQKPNDKPVKLPMKVASDPSDPNKESDIDPVQTDQRPNDLPPKKCTQS